MLLRCALLLAACSLAGCNSQAGTTAMASSDSVNLTFSPEPGVRSGYVRIRPRTTRSTSTAAEYEWRMKGAGLPGAARFYKSSFLGDGPVELTLQFSGAVEFDARVLLRLEEGSGQVKATQRVEISAGKTDGKLQEKTWTVPGSLKDSVKIEQSKITEMELPARAILAKVGGKDVVVNFDQSRF